MHHHRVTLAHDRKAAVAAGYSKAGPQIGIDLVDEDDAGRIHRIQDRVLSPAERVLASGEPRAFLLAWGTREAVAKATRTGMFAYALERVHVLHIDWAKKTLETNLPGVTVAFEAIQGSYVVIAAVESRTVEEARRIADLPPEL